MYEDIQLLHERGYNITIGYVDVMDGDGELLKETFDVDHMSLPCIRLVKDGRFHEMVFFQTTFALDSYKGFLDGIDDGTSAALSMVGRPRVTKYSLWYEYVVTFMAREENLNQLFDAYNESRKVVQSYTGFNHDLMVYEENFNRRNRFKKQLLFPKSHARTLLWYFIFPILCSFFALMLIIGLLMDNFCCAAKSTVVNDGSAKKDKKD